MTLRLKLISRTFVIVATLALFGLPALANAELMPKAKIAIVDINHVLANSLALKGAEQSLKNEAKIITDSLKLDREALLERKKQLDLQRAILTQGVFIQKLDALNAEGRKLQRQAQATSGELNKALNRIRRKLRERIIQIATGVGAKNGANIGLDRVSTVFFDNTMDITPQVLEAFNKENPKINITVEKKQ